MVIWGKCETLVSCRNSEDDNDDETTPPPRQRHHRPTDLEALHEVCEEKPLELGDPGALERAKTKAEDTVRSGEVWSGEELVEKV